MEQFVWKEEYSVGNQHMDSHHKKLIRLIEEIGHIIRQDDDTMIYSTVKIISELKVYAIFHFTEEEHLMEAASYPDLAFHKEQHKAFIKKIESLKSDYLNNIELINNDIFHFLKNWLSHHILELDQKYVEYL